MSSARGQISKYIVLAALELKTCMVIMRVVTRKTRLLNQLGVYEV